jgi:hypothetical protein
MDDDDIYEHQMSSDEITEGPTIHDEVPQDVYEQRSRENQLVLSIEFEEYKELQCVRTLK